MDLIEVVYMDLWVLIEGIKWQGLSMNPLIHFQILLKPSLRRLLGHKGRSDTDYGILILIVLYVVQ